MSDKKDFDTIRVIELSSYVKPKLVEAWGGEQDYVLNGKNNSFFDYVDERYNGSPTNSAIIDSYTDRIYGRGLTILNANIVPQHYVGILKLFPKKDVRKIVYEFKKYGSAIMAVRYSKSDKKTVATVDHIERKCVAPAKKVKGEVVKYWFCEDWARANTEGLKPISYPAFGKGKYSEKTEFYEIRLYQSGRDYYADPDYLAGLQYAHLEEEIANYSINHIMNGLSAGSVINFNNGVPSSDEKKDEIEKKVLNKVTGSSNAARVIISFNDDKESATTVGELPSGGNHEQWEFWAGEARQQVMVSHRVTSPILFGVRDSSGLGNNANEIQEATKLLNQTVISPYRNVLLDAFSEIAMINDVSSPIGFIPLEDEIEDKKEEINNEKKMTDEEKKKSEVALNKHYSNCADKLIELGEEIPETDYEIAEEREVIGHNLGEDKLNMIIELASVPSGDARKRSDQDTSLFKVRYQYAGSADPEREFCRKLIKANKVYRHEDLKKAEEMVVNEGFGLEGADKYSIFLYKGGVNCKHWWKRVIYLKRNNKRISVNQAKKMILELDPVDRPDAKWDRNPKEVAEIASKSNDYWRAS
jgi:hypothetical protein